MNNLMNILENKDAFNKDHWWMQAMLGIYTLRLLVKMGVLTPAQLSVTSRVALGQLEQKYPQERNV